MRLFICPGCRNRTLQHNAVSMIICERCHITIKREGMHKISERGSDWVQFGWEVLDHIEKYTIPQYGDVGEDQCTEFTVQDFQTQIKKYANRMGRNSRPGQDKLDLLKMAHYIQMLYDKLED